MILALDARERRDHSFFMKLVAIHGPLGSFFVHPLLALGATIVFALALESGFARGMGHGSGGGGHAGGGGGHAASSTGSGGHAGAGQVGSSAGHAGGGQAGGGQFGAGHFGHPGGHQSVFCNHQHGRGFSGLVALGVPFGVPSYSEYPPYPSGADPYCDPSSPWYNPAYCHWRHRDK